MSHPTATTSNRRSTKRGNCSALLIVLYLSRVDSTLTEGLFCALGNVLNLVAKCLCADKLHSAKRGDPLSLNSCKTLQASSLYQLLKNRRSFILDIGQRSFLANQGVPDLHFVEPFACEHTTDVAGKNPLHLFVKNMDLLAAGFCSSIYHVQA